jgi:hypothetical protein
MPTVGRPDQFEQDYTTRLRAVLSAHGEFIAYDRDRAALDLGLHLYEQPVDGDAELGQVRVWFQLKGIQASTLSADDLEAVERVPVSGLPVKQIEYWFAHPEPVYLAVYLEATKTFLAEDVRDLVEREGGRPWLARCVGEQETTTLHLEQRASLDQAMLQMPRHRSLRMDGPDFRGRPLGHRFDPLRCELNLFAPQDFRDLVERLLKAHDFRRNALIDPTSLFAGDPGSVSAMTGQLYLTYEWTTPLSTEFGYDPGSDFRIEGKPFSVQGDVLVVIHSDVQDPPRASESSKRLVESLQQEGIEQALVFMNTSEGEARMIGGWRVALEPLLPVPQGLGSLAFNVLTATNVYFEFLDRLTWRFVSYR